MDRNRYTTVIPAARALAARLGLDCAWVGYIAMLWLQSTLLFAQVGAGYRLSAKAVVLHLALIGLIAVLQATFWNTLPGKGALHRWGRPIVAGTIQLVLLLLYLANFGSLVTISSRFNASLVAVYLSDPLPLVAASGFHPALAGAALVLLALMCVGTNIFLVRRWASDNTTTPLSLAFATLGVAAYVLLIPQMDKAEFLHRLEGA